MKNNLYKLIKSLHEEDKKLYHLAPRIRFDKNQADLYKKICDRREEIYRTLKAIESKYVITCQDLEKIISKAKRKHYKLKIFRETYTKNGETYLTNRYIACYLNKSNSYYNYDKDGFELKNLWCPKEETYVNYALDTKEFVEFKKSLEETDSYILSNSDELTFIPALAPSCYLEKINFVKTFTRNRFDDIANRNFQYAIDNWIKQALENVNICENTIEELQK